MAGTRERLQSWRSYNDLRLISFHQRHGANVKFWQSWRFLFIYLLQPFTVVVSRHRRFACPLLPACPSRRPMPALHSLMQKQRDDTIRNIRRSSSPPPPGTRLSRSSEAATAGASLSPELSAVGVKIAFFSPTAAVRHIVRPVVASQVTSQYYHPSQRGGAAAACKGSSRRPITGCGPDTCAWQRRAPTKLL